MRYQRHVVTAAGLLALLSTPHHADGWGCEGHQTVAFIAQSQLNAHARSQVDAILKKSPIQTTMTASGGKKITLYRRCPAPQSGAFVDSSTWADDIRGTPFDTWHSSEWHFIDIPRDANQSQAGTFCSPTGCVTKAMNDQLAILQSQATNNKKAAALRFLIHFAGDVHQPLHCTTNGDRGGNCVPVAFFTATLPSVPASGKVDPNLHAIWDTNMIQKDPTFSTPDAYATALTQQFQGQITGWQTAGGTPADWAWQSHELANSTAYGKLPAGIPIANDHVDITSCVLSGDNISRDMAAFDEVLGQPYQQAAQPVIQEQLTKAGTRLAMLLNQVWP
jgi:hypothetical protein